MLLAIDAGNTRIKWGLFDQGGKLLDSHACLHADFTQAMLPASRQIILGSVANTAVTSMIINQLPESAELRIASAAQYYKTLTNLYDAPLQLGVDRWAAAIAAWKSAQGSCLIVNAGTAITVDAIRAQDDNASFLGGWISPGLRLLQMQLSENTAQLKNSYSDLTIDVKNAVLPFGLNTQSAIKNGTMSSAVGMIKQGYQQLSSLSKQPVTIVMSGGDATSIAPYCEAIGLTIQVDEQLVLKGLYAINQQH